MLPARVVNISRSPIKINYPSILGECSTPHTDAVRPASDSGHTGPVIVRIYCICVGRLERQREREKECAQEQARAMASEGHPSVTLCPCVCVHASLRSDSQLLPHSRPHARWHSVHRSNWRADGFGVRERHILPFNISAF